MGLHAEILASEWIRDVEQWRVRAARASLHIFKTEWSASSRLASMASRHWQAQDQRTIDWGRTPTASSRTCGATGSRRCGWTGDRRHAGARSFATMSGLSTDLTKPPQSCATCDFVKSLAKALLGQG